MQKKKSNEDVENSVSKQGCLDMKRHKQEALSAWKLEELVSESIAFEDADSDAEEWKKKKRWACKN